MIKGAYSGSLIQQEFGESTEKHGYLIWDITDNTYEEVDIDNDYKFITITINKGFDYKNISYTLKESFKYLRLRILWTDVENMSIENENLVKKYFTEKYNPIEFRLKKIKQTKLEKTQKIKKVALARNKERVSEILQDYLKANQVDSDTIKNVLEFDDFVTNRLQDNKNADGYEISIDGILIDNFRSYASDQFIDLRNKNGLIQVVGKNQLGKTTIFDAICYCLFGKTMYPPKQKKHKDSKYINFNNNRNDCKVSLHLLINQIPYQITRTTEVEYKPDGYIKNCTTKLIIENNSGFSENDINEEQFKSIIGSFDEFALTNFTTGDTLTAILSSDVSVFKDMIIKSSGLGVFEQKTEEVKKYRKERLDKYGKITLNQEKEEEEILTLKKEIKEIEKEVFDTEQKIEKENKLLQNIENEIFNISISLSQKESISVVDISSIEKKKIAVQDKIESYRKSISINSEKLRAFEQIIIDEEKYLNLQTQSKELRTQENKFVTQLRSLQDIKLSIEYKIKALDNELKKIKNEGLELKNKLETIDNSKVCVLCKQPLDETHIKHIEEEKIKLSKDIENKRLEYQTKTLEKETTLSEQKSNLLEIETIEKMAEETIEKNSVVLEKIATIDYERKKLEEADRIKESNQIMLDSITSFESELYNIEKAIEDFYFNKEKIEEVKMLKVKLEEAESAKRSKEQLIKTLADNVFNNKIKIQSNLKDIQYKEETIIKYSKQRQYEKMEKLYLEAISRNGIPTLLLKSNIPDINDALDYLLSDVNFSLSFDDELNLVFKKGDYELDIMTGTSGMERTFLACALKMSLIKASNVSVFDTIIMDEIMDKLDSDNLQLFTDMIAKIKKWNNRVMVINHLHDISPDFILVPYHKNNMTYIDIR